MGTLLTWLQEKVVFFFYIRQPRLFSFLSSWSDSNWLSRSLRRDKSLAKSLHFFFLPPPLANFSGMGQGGQSLSSLPLDWVRRLKLDVCFKIVSVFPASCFSFFLFVLFFKFFFLWRSENYVESATIKSFTVSSQRRNWCILYEDAESEAKSPQQHVRKLPLSLPVLLIEIIAVTHFTRRRARGSRSLTWFSWEGWFGHSGSDRSSIDSPFARGEGSMPPSLYPRFAEEKQESARETKTSMGTVAPVSPCLWLLLLGGLCLPFWTQVLLPPSLKHPATTTTPVCGCRGVAVSFSDPWHPPSESPSPPSAEVVCHLHLQERALHLALPWIILGASLVLSSRA